MINCHFRAPLAFCPRAVGWRGFFAFEQFMPWGCPNAKKPLQPTARRQKARGAQKWQVIFVDFKKQPVFLKTASGGANCQERLVDLLAWSSERGRSSSALHRERSELLSKAAPPTLADAPFSAPAAFWENGRIFEIFEEKNEESRRIYSINLKKREKNKN